MKQLRVGLVLVLFLLVGVILSYFYTDWMTIQVMNYNEHEGLDFYDLQRYSDIKIGQRFFQVSTDQAAENLGRHNYVKSARVERRFPDTVDFIIDYRSHFITLSYSGVFLSLDEDLIALRTIDSPGPGYVVEGFQYNAYSLGQVIAVEDILILERITNLINLLNQTDIVAGKVIAYDKDGINISIGDITVKFGDGKNLEKRFNSFVTIYDDLERNGVTTGVIDVSSDGLPAYVPFGK